MNIPKAKYAAGVLRRMYRDRARIERSGIGDDGLMRTEIIYDDIRCHLSGKKGLGQGVSSSFNQTEGQGEVKMSFLAYFPPECDIRAGDLITVQKGKRSFCGRAGMPVFGEMAIKVALDSIEAT